MGLGLLFIGYLLVSIFTFAPTYFLTDLVGSFVMYEALVKLRPHADRFRYAIWSVYALFAVSAVQCLYYSLTYIGAVNDISLVENIIEICRVAVMFVYTLSMLMALAELARSVGDRKLADKCMRNVWLHCVNYFFIITLSLDFEFLQGYISAFAALALLIKLLCAVLISANIYSCYMWICLESDHDMTQKNKPSKIGEFLRKVKNGGEDDFDKSALSSSEPIAPLKTEKPPVTPVNYGSHKKKKKKK